MKIVFIMNYSWYFSIILFLVFIVTGKSLAQISPGELTKAHSNLEGISNCIKCHEVGKKVISAKCLECHKEIKELINANMGYHASAMVKGKECFACHNEHHGRNFEIIRFDTTKFDHRTTQYELAGKHSSLGCKSCHKAEFIKVKKSQKTRGGSYLGLGTTCLDCHPDYHQGTLSANCSACHTPNAFKPVLGFDHKRTKYPLAGKHQTVDCAKCHKVTEVNGKKFQKFSGIAFSNCTDCHKDVHENKFGKDCKKCHNEESFLKVTGLNVFNHNKTDYPLEGMHLAVDCKACHKQSLTAKLSFNLCSDCHRDYHKGQLKKPGINTDCKECHDLNGFTTSNFTVERHNKGNFLLEGSHLATPCFACHKKDKDWVFKDLKRRCIDCHENIHQNFIEEKFFKDQNCESCHSVIAWSRIRFDHNSTDFKLTGKHADVNCKRCHFKQDGDGTVQQRFSDLTNRCLDCHVDVHNNQFDIKDNISCTRCHGYDQWKPVRFNHDNTRFKLDGSHKDVACTKCHKEVSNGTRRYIRYKFEDIKCASCHLH
jgi:hypothetical protein